MTRRDDSIGSLPSRRVAARLLRLSWDYRGRVLWVLSLQAALVALTVGGLGFTGLAVDVLRHSLDEDVPAPRWPLSWVPPTDWSALTQLQVLGVGVLVMALLRGLLSYAHEIAAGSLVHVHIVPTLRARLFRRLQRLSFRFFDSHPTGSIINRLTSDVQMLRSFVDGVLVQGTILVLSLGVFLSYMLSTHVRLTLVSLALTPLLFWATRVFSRWATEAYQTSRRLSDGMVRSLTEGIDGIVVTKVFGREEDQLRRFEQHNRAVLEQQRGIFRNVSRYTPAIDLLNQLNLAVLLAYGAYLVALAQVSLGQLVVFAGLLQQFANRASAMATVVNTLQQSLTGARRVFDVLDSAIEVESPAQPKCLERIRGALTFHAIGFSYDGERRVLEGIELEVAPGTCLGVFGATGAGKSTWLSLIPRFYDPTEGRILLDGCDLRELDVSVLRRSIGIVFQETFLFRDTVANNIAFSDPEADMERVVNAAKAAGAHRFIEELPGGYQCVLDEGAVNLSGGQRQRLAIARALLTQPPILILDDPTTAVDAETEADVLDALDRASSGRTTFVVSNRVSALRRADTVVVLSGGRIVERGTPRELLERDGIYSQVARLQGGTGALTDQPSAPLPLSSPGGEVRS